MAVNNHEISKEITFLPFYAINKYMHEEYRLSVIRSTVQTLPELPAVLRSSIERIIKQSVNVPGFRNGAKAPSGLLIKPLVKAFEKKSIVVAAILEAWVEIHTELRDQVFSLLNARKWNVKPLDADRMNSPGFIPNLPPGENFDSLQQAFIEMFPNEKAESDDLILMSIWLSGRLPYEGVNLTIPEV